MIPDTYALSAIADGDRSLERTIEQASELAIPAIVLGEYKFGIMRSRNRRMYERWLAELADVCPVLAIDENTAGHYAEIRSELKASGHPIPANDLWIAAIVRQHRQPLLSRDAHFDCVAGLKRIAW